MLINLKLLRQIRTGRKTSSCTLLLLPLPLIRVHETPPTLLHTIEIQYLLAHLRSAVVFAVRGLTPSFLNPWFLKYNDVST